MFCAGCGAGLTAVQPTKKTGLIIAAGILDILAGVYSILSVVFMGALMLFIINVGGEIEGDAALDVISGIRLISSIVAIVAGILLLLRKKRAMAITGAVGATLTLSPFGVAALIVTVIARKEFERKLTSNPPPLP